MFLLLAPLLGRVALWSGASYVATKIVDGIETTDNDIELQKLANENDGGITIGDIAIVTAAVVGGVLIYKVVKK